MYCIKCGKKISDDSQFCEYCGAEIPEDLRMPPEAEESEREDMYVVEPEPVEYASESDPGHMNEEYVEEEIPKRTRRTAPQGSGRGKRVVFALVAIAVVVCAAMAAFRTLHKPTISLNKYLDVTFDGYDTIGTAAVVFDTEQFRKDYGEKLKDDETEDTENAAALFLADCVNGSLSEESGLSNGDTVTYQWNCNDEYALEEYGYKLSYTDKEFTVSNLQEAATFDPFEGVDVDFAGIAPNGYAEVNRDAAVNEEVQELSYTLSTSEGLSNGDEVTVTVSCWQGDDVNTYCLENFGKIPSSTEKTYTVKNLQSYVGALSDIPEDELTQMKSQAETVYTAWVARDWSEWVELKDLTYIGVYLLVSKDSGSSTNYRNMLYLVYCGESYIEYSGTGTNNAGKSVTQTYKVTITDYWYIRYTDLLVNEDGSMDVNILEYDTPDDTFSVDSGISSGWYSTQSWSYDGYQTLDELYRSVVSAQADRYSCEEAVDGSQTKSGTSSMTEETSAEAESSEEGTSSAEKGTSIAEDGIVFSDSSERLLTEEEVAALSDDDLQRAINELYARAGYIFEDDTFTEYYSQYDWYVPTVAKKDFVDSEQFSDIELANQKLMIAERNSRNEKED